MPVYRRNGGTVARTHPRVRVAGSTLGAGRLLKGAADPPPPPPPDPGTSGATVYTAEPLGAGGWVTGISISPDGLTRLARTDTLGAWRWDTTADAWKAAITGTSMPTGYKGLDSGAGVQAIVAANDVAFMAYQNGIFKSVDKGLTWTVSALNVATTKPNTGNQRWWNTRMAVDPTNQDRALYGTLLNGLLYTTNRGASWTTATAVPNGTAGAPAYGIPCVAIDTAGNWYAAPHGSGVYRSTDQGTTWTQITATTPLIVVTGMAAGPNGDVMVTGHTSTAMDAASSVVYRWRTGAWTQITVGVTGAGNSRPWRSVAYDPLNPGAMMLQGDGGYERRSSDYGDTFIESWNSFTSDTPDVPWLAAANGYAVHYFYVTVGGLQFDPTVSGRVWMSQGIGVWAADLPPTLTDDVPWRAQSRGIEQLVVNDALAPPGGPALAVSWDRPVFVVGETTSVPIVSIAPPLTVPVGYGGSLNATLVRGYPNPITHAWSVVTKPGSSAGGTIVSPTALSTAFVPDVAGDYTLRLTSTNAVGSHTADVNVTATAKITGLILPGATGNYVQTPDAPDLNVTGDLTLIARLSMSDWAPATKTTIIGKHSATSRSYRLSVDNTGVGVFLETTANGATGFHGGTAIPLTFAPGSAHWIRLVYNATAQTSVVSLSDDGVTWTLHKSQKTNFSGPLGPLATSTAPLTLGWSGSASSGFVNGRIYKAQVWSGTTLVADFDATAVTRTGTRTPATYTGATGKIWTPQGTEWDWS